MFSVSDPISLLNPEGLPDERLAEDSEAVSLSSKAETRAGPSGPSRPSRSATLGPALILSPPAVSPGDTEFDDQRSSEKGKAGPT